MENFESRNALVQSQESLQASEERYRLLVNMIRDYAIFLLSPEGTIQTWNIGAERLKGYTANEIIGQNFQRFYSEEDLLRHHPQHELEIAKTTGRYEEEGWRIRKDGTRFWANVIITRLSGQNEAHIGFVKVTRDLTERKLAEEALKESEERFRLIVESVKDYAIIMLNPDGYVASWNEGARRLKGFEAREIIGSHFSKFYEAEEIESGKCEYELKEAEITGRFEDEGWRIRKDGTKFWANVIITALRDTKNELRGYAKVTRDMTERKRAEDRLKLAHQNLEKRVIERTKELQRAVESRDEFLSIASHELRTPLTALSLQQQILQRKIESVKDGMLPIEQLTGVLQLATRQIAQLDNLIGDMLDVSRIATGRMRVDLRTLDFSDLVAKVFGNFSLQFQAAHIKASYHASEGLRVLCDEKRMEQVITNLLTNAKKYGAGSAVEVSTRRDNGMIKLIVRDFGPGIDPQDHDRIFRRFERAVEANEVSGLGLGLYISKQIMDSLGGTIQVESTPSKGATFVVSLPAYNNL